MSNTSAQTETSPEPAKPERAVVPVSPAIGKDKEKAERSALDPTRYGDWEKNGRCIDF